MIQDTGTVNLNNGYRMNKILKEIAVKAQVEHCISHVRLEEFAELLITDVIEQMRQPQVGNRCVYTTFDLDKSNCVKSEIEKFIKQRYKDDV